MSVSSSMLKKLEHSGPMTEKELKKAFGIHTNTKMENTGLLPYLEKALDHKPSSFVISGHWEWRWRHEHGEV